MSSGELRRSMRIFELEARKAQLARRKNNGNGTTAIATKHDLDTGGDSRQSHGRKKIKTRPVQDLVGDTINYQAHKASSSLDMDHLIYTDQVALSSRTAMPEKSKLELLLSTLQRRDCRKFFAEPVDPIEVEDYYDVIEEPMDFGTITSKLNEGSYTTLEEFEHDVFLVFSNAMLFNASTTVYYRQARAIKEVAERLFDALKTDPENFEAECLKQREAPGRKSRVKKFYCLGHKDERRFEYFEGERRDTYWPWNTLNENGSLVSMVYESPQDLFQVNGGNIDYTKRLLKFVEDLGPTAQMVARRKIERFIEGCKIQNSTFHNQHQPTRNQMFNVAFTPKGANFAESLNFLGGIDRPQMSSGEDFSFQRSFLSGEKASTVKDTVLSNALMGGIAQGGFSVGVMEGSGDFRGKEVQAMGLNQQLQALQNPVSAVAYVQRGIKVSPSLVIPGNSVGERQGIQSSIIDGGEIYALESMNAWDASSRGTTLGGCLAEAKRGLKGKEMQEDLGVEFEMGAAFRNNVMNQNAADKTFDFLTAWNRNSNIDEYGFPNMLQDVVNPIQTAPVASPDSSMLEFVPTRNTTAFSSLWWPPQTMAGQTNTSHAIVSQSMQGIDSLFLDGAHQTPGMIEGNCPGYTRNIEQGGSGQVPNWFKPVELEPKPAVCRLELEPELVLCNSFQPLLRSIDVGSSRGAGPSSFQPLLMSLDVGSSRGARPNSLQPPLRLLDVGSSGARPLEQRNWFDEERSLDVGSSSGAGPLEQQNRFHDLFK